MILHRTSGATRPPSTGGSLKQTTRLNPSAKPAKGRTSTRSSAPADPRHLGGRGQVPGALGERKAPKQDQDW